MCVLYVNININNNLPIKQYVWLLYTVTDIIMRIVIEETGVGPDSRQVPIFSSS